MISGIILAGGNGTRIKSHIVNKVTLPYLGKPMVLYGVELMEGIVDVTVVTTGAYAHSVENVLTGKRVIFAHQEDRLGTAHAVKTGIGPLVTRSPLPTRVIVGYGDHMMFYTKATIKKLLDFQAKSQAVVTLITFEYNDPNALAFGRIIRNSEGNITDIIEQKDASEEIRQIKELNAGFYCFDYNFLSQNIDKVKPSPVTGEYYLTDMAKIAIEQKKVVNGLKVPFEQVGIGINTQDDFQKSTAIYHSVK